MAHAGGDRCTCERVTLCGAIDLISCYNIARSKGQDRMRLRIGRGSGWGRKSQILRHSTFEFPACSV